MKILKSRKALSPVIAAIILIAVTVAVSIAVAAWMGALTIGLMGGGEQLKIVDVTYDQSGKKVSIEVMNTGVSTITISDIRIDEKKYDSTAWNGTCTDLTGDSTYDLDKGESHTFEITFTSWPFSSGVKYSFTVVTAQGNSFGPYTKTAPS